MIQFQLTAHMGENFIHRRKGWAANTPLASSDEPKSYREELLRGGQKRRTEKKYSERWRFRKKMNFLKRMLVQGRAIYGSVGARSRRSRTVLARIAGVKGLRRKAR